MAAQNEKPDTCVSKSDCYPWWRHEINRFNAIWTGFYIKMGIFLPSVKVTHEYAKGSYKNRKLMIYHIKSAIKYFNKYGWIFDFHRRKINQNFLAKYYNNSTG